MREALSVIVLAAGILSCAGGVPQIKLVVNPTGAMNGSRSCFLLARVVNEETFIAESYDDVAARAMDPDDSVQRKIVLLPGMPQEVTIDAPAKGRLAIYALFRSPEDNGWRVLLPAKLPAKVELRLDRGLLCWVDQKTAKGPATCYPPGWAVQQRVGTGSEDR